MTISSTTRKAGPTPGNGVATSFPFAFKVFSVADVVITLAELATGITNTLVYGSDYSVSLNADQNANPGGSVTYSPSGGPMTALYTLTITSAVQQTQQTDITNGGAFLPNVVEDMADRNTILVQQLSEIVNRSVKLPLADAALTTTLPLAAQRANKALIFDALGNVVVSGDNYANQTAAVTAVAAQAAASAASASTSATAAAGSATSAAGSATSANTSAGTATAAASTAQGYIAQALGFTAGSAYDFGSVADPIVLFPTNWGSVP